jgi:hypothetical protein
MLGAFSIMTTAASTISPIATPPSSAISTIRTQIADAGGNDGPGAVRAAPACARPTTGN